MERYKISENTLKRMVFEGTKKALKEEIDDYLENLVDNVSITLTDKYGFGTEAAYAAAEKSVAQLDDTDSLSGDEQEDFDAALQRSMSNYVNESLTKKSIKEGQEEYEALRGSVAICLSMIDNTFKRDDIDNVSPDVLKDLIIRIYDELSPNRVNL